MIFLRHTREGGYADALERFSQCRWIPAFAGMTDGSQAARQKRTGAVKKDF